MCGSPSSSERLGIFPCTSLTKSSTFRTSEADALPTLLLQLLPNGLDALAVDVEITVADAGRAAVLNEVPGASGEVKLHIVNELRPGETSGQGQTTRPRSQWYASEARRYGSRVWKAARSGSIREGRRKNQGYEGGISPVDHCRAEMSATHSKCRALELSIQVVVSLLNNGGGEAIWLDILDLQSHCGGSRNRSAKLHAQQIGIESYARPWKEQRTSRGGSPLHGALPLLQPGWQASSCHGPPRGCRSCGN